MLVRPFIYIRIVRHIVLREIIWPYIISSRTDSCFRWPCWDSLCSRWPCSSTKHLQNRAVGPHVQNLGVRGWSLFGKVGQIGGGPGQAESYCPRLEHARNGSIRDGFALLARAPRLSGEPPKATTRVARVDINLIILVLLFGSHPVHVPTLLLFERGRMALFVTYLSNVKSRFQFSLFLELKAIKFTSLSGWNTARLSELGWGRVIVSFCLCS